MSLSAVKQHVTVPVTSQGAVGALVGGAVGLLVGLNVSSATSNVGAAVVGDAVVGRKVVGLNVVGAFVVGAPEVGDLDVGEGVGLVGVAVSMGPSYSYSVGAMLGRELGACDGIRV